MNLGALRRLKVVNGNSNNPKGVVLTFLHVVRVYQNLMLSPHEVDGRL